VPFQTLYLPGHAIEPARQRRFETVGAIRQQMRSEHRLDDQGLGTRCCAAYSANLLADDFRLPRQSA
jgi:hypothetical protein